MMGELCKYLNNYFLRDGEARHFGTFTISGGSFTADSLSFLQEGQYFRIVGSVFNDGVHQYPAAGLTDETFDGAIWAMSVPAAVLELAAEISTWTQTEAVRKASESPYSSESFGGYSYSKETSADGSGLSWQSHFSAKLAPWRKARVNG